MRHLLTLTASLLLALAPSIAQADTQAIIRTNMGNITLRLDETKAPQTVANFVAYARQGHYDGTIFHRVIDGFMIQGGGFDANMNPKPTRKAINSEADNGLKNQRYSVAMARLNTPHSATSQFFINVADNDFLNHQNKTPSGWGYTVFGQVTAGHAVVDKIAKVRTRSQGIHANVPIKPIIIQSIFIEP